MKKFIVISVLCLFFVNCYSQEQKPIKLAKVEFIKMVDSTFTISYSQILSKKMRNTVISGLAFTTGYFIPIIFSITGFSNPIFFGSFIFITGAHLTRLIILEYKLKKEL